MALALGAILGAVVYFAFADRAAARRSERASADAPDSSNALLCGRCRYDTRGLPGGVCPECGGDLSVVGTVAAGARRPLPFALRLFVWTLVGLFAFSALIDEPLRRYGPRVREQEVYGTEDATLYDPVPPDGQRSASVSYAATRRQRYWGWRGPDSAPADVVLTLWADGRSGPRFEATPGAAGVRLLDAQGKVIRPFARLDELALTALCRASGLRVDDEIGGALVADLWQRVRDGLGRDYAHLPPVQPFAPLLGPPPRTPRRRVDLTGTLTGQSSGDEPASITLALSPVLFVLLWLTGAWLLRSRCRARRA